MLSALAGAFVSRLHQSENCGQGCRAELDKRVNGGCLDEMKGIGSIIEGRLQSVQRVWRFEPMETSCTDGANLRIVAGDCPAEQVFRPRIFDQQQRAQNRLAMGDILRKISRAQQGRHSLGPKLYQFLAGSIELPRVP